MHKDNIQKGTEPKENNIMYKNVAEAAEKAFQDAKKHISQFRALLEVVWEKVKEQGA